MAGGHVLLQGNQWNTFRNMLFSEDRDTHGLALEILFSNKSIIIPKRSIAKVIARIRTILYHELVKAVYTDYRNYSDLNKEVMVIHYGVERWEKMKEKRTEEIEEGKKWERKIAELERRLQKPEGKRRDKF